MFDNIVEEVPDYKTFDTVDELKASSEKLVRKHPSKTEIFVIGKSRKGEEIKALRIGKGRKTALLFGFPHPNEPIGSMTLEYLSWRLAEDETLDKLDFTWYIIKCVDPDGARLNEGWFKGPFTPLNYALNYYRPPGYQQIEWTFPIKYKTLVWDTPIPETRALMKIMEDVKPQFMYSLHNSGFGGVYFYVSSRCKPLYPQFQNLAKKEMLPLHLGEPETPYMKKLAEAIFKMPTSVEAYEFLKKHTNKDPAEIINYGTSSDDYARRVAESFTLVCEMPYYYDPRIGDTSESDVIRREAVLHSVAIAEERYNFVKEKYSKVKASLKEYEEKRPFRDAIEDTLKRFPDSIAAQKHWAKTDPQLKRKATVAEKFDSHVLSRFYDLLSLGLLHRCVKDTKNGGVEKEILQQMKEWNDRLERQLSYKVIPIRSLVRVQLGSALLTAEYIRQKR
ncbi:MAG: M14 family zinc carboxypeptidase [Candidatus Bathyarchaeota archaeon]|nr:M14 family zinc carboxypeptidase [Candidatus Bathyarchaeota archaeon]MDH5732494.1 M14 family zinc carboxypeptidase [Candidatus Bathyarchaeota archaeon]